MKPQVFKIRISNLSRISHFGFRILIVMLLSSLLFPKAWSLSITDVHKEYLQGNYEEAIRSAKNLRENDEVLYFLGLAYIKIGNYSKARIFLRKLIGRFPNSKFYNSGMIKIADSYFLDKDYSKAKVLYLEIEKKGVSGNMPLALLRLAQIASREGRWSEKGKYLRRIKSKYPGASEIKFVKVLEAFGDFFTIQVGAFSVKTNARSLVEELKNEYSSYMVEDKEGSYPIYKVRVGRFKSRYEAMKVSSKLLNAGYPTRIYP